MISSPWQAGDGLRAYQGKIDLRGIQDPDFGMTKLNGEWEFSWLQGPEKGIENHSVEFIGVPGSWTNESKSNQTYPKFGYGIYRLKVFLPEIWKKKILSVSLGAIASAYRIKINEQIIGECGTPGIDPDSIVSRIEPRDFLFLRTKMKFKSRFLFLIILLRCLEFYFPFLSGLLIPLAFQKRFHCFLIYSLLVVF